MFVQENNSLCPEGHHEEYQVFPYPSFLKPKVYICCIELKHWKHCTWNSQWFNDKMLGHRIIFEKDTNEKTRKYSFNNAFKDHKV